MAKSWRDVLKVHPAADLFPMMSPDEIKSLGEDIQRNGQRVPIVLWAPTPDDHGRWQLLDGRNRLDAAELAGIEVVSIRTDKGGRVDVTAPHRHLYGRDGGRSAIDGTSLTADPYEYVLSANVHRRHLTGEQKRELIAKVLKAQPGSSNRRIGELARVDHKTVGSVRDELEGRGEIPHVELRQDSKGRQQPAQKPPPDRAESREVRQQAKAERRAERESELAQRITALPTKQYGVILADAAWRFEVWSRETGMDRAADNHYPTMTTEEIKALDVAAIAAPISVLFQWATVPMLPAALEVLKAWGFEYRSHFAWIKDRVGKGYWNRNKHELLLIGARGKISSAGHGRSMGVGH